MTQKPEPIPKHVWQTAAAVLLAPLMAQLDSTVVNLSLSTIQTQLHTQFATVQWVISGYLLALALALPINAWLVDRIGAKRLYLWCFGAFTFASLLCGLSNSIELLIAARVLQGIAGGLLSPMTQMMIAKVAGKNMAKVMGYAAMPVLIAPLFGPLLAGVILKHASWPWLFYINVPIGIFAMTLASILLPADEPSPVRRSFDWKGFLLISPALVALLYGLEHLLVLTGQFCLLVGSVMLVQFVRYSAKQGNQALLDLQLFKVKDFYTAAITLFLHTGGMFAGQMLIPLYLTVGCHMPPARAGSLVAIMGIGMLCSYPFVGVLVEKFGARRVAVSGALLLTFSTIPILWMANSHLTAAVMMASLVIRGIGQSAIGIPSVSTGYSKIPKDRLPQATTASNIVQRLGGPVATTVMAIVLSVSMNHAHTADEHSYVFPFIALIFWQILLLCSAMRLPTKERSPQLSGS